METTIKGQIETLLTRHGIPFSIITLDQMGLNSDEFSGHATLGRRQIHMKGKYRVETKCGIETFVVVSLSLNNQNLPIGRR